MDADAVARELYALPPGEFVAARDAQVAAARQAGERELATEIKAMRRPTVAAWVANRFALEQGARLEQLFSLGAALREAQSTLSADKLRQLGEQRRQVIGALAGEAAALAAELGHTASASVVGDVEQTLQAALADPDAAELVRAGRLTTALSYTGFGEAGAASPPSSSGRSRAPAKGKGKKQRAGAGGQTDAETERRAQLRGALQDAETALASATAASERADEELEDARSGRERCAGAVEDLEQQLAEARTRMAEADAEIKAARQVQRRAASALKAARTATDKARAAVDDA
jgi:DNA repair exonuclease SbcCD ATPase subunit